MKARVLAHHRNPQSSQHPYFFLLYFFLEIRKRFFGSRFFKIYFSGFAFTLPPPTLCQLALLLQQGVHRASTPRDPPHQLVRTADHFLPTSLLLKHNKTVFRLMVICGNRSLLLPVDPRRRRRSKLKVGWKPHVSPNNIKNHGLTQDGH